MVNASSAQEVKRRKVNGTSASTADSTVEETEIVMEEKKEEPVVLVNGTSKAQAMMTPDVWLLMDSVILPLIFTAIGIFTRMYKIGKSDIVTWDEAHFGKFGSHYLKREFYFDVHPPLGKMLVGLSGYMAGYNGSFAFDSGTKYPPEVNYVFMRMFNAAFAVGCVPVAYYTARQLKLSRAATCLFTTLVICENSYATLGRFILLDSMLMFFTVTTMACLATVHRLRYKQLSVEWFIWLFLTGISIGCVCSVKWVGALVTALVGLYTIEDLWNKLGDVEMPYTTYAKHWMARIVGLIIIPAMVYMAAFKIHFLILENSGPGDAQMSSLFQANLRGTDLLGSPLEVALGSRATIKNMGYGGGLLHSHVQTYPEGSEQQQVTCYHHKDANNEWFFFPTREEPEYTAEDTQAPLRYVGNGQTVRLIHAQTGRNLHSHQVAAPVTKSNWEVSCYGNLTIGDEKDYWEIEVVKDAYSRDHSRLRTLTSAFRLRHKVLGCYLRAANVNLPQWGFKQIEVTCDKDSTKNDIFSHWNIESHWNDRMQPGDAKAYRSPFFSDFIHLNVAMMTSNNALVPDPDKQDDLASQAWQWPLSHVGLRMCGWDNHIIKYFLLGNPANVWLSSASILMLGAIVVFYILRWQRKYNDFTPAMIEHIKAAGVYPALGFALHYFPFFIMGRVLYVHHYMPALYFALLTQTFLIDHLTLLWLGKLPWLRVLIFTMFAAISIGVFFMFRDISFGMEGDAKRWAHLEWLKSWKIAHY